MQEIVSTVTSKGQVTIPAAVRRHLGVGANDKITFAVEDDGRVSISVPTYPTIESLRGIAGSLPRPLSWQEIEEIAQEGPYRAGGDVRVTDSPVTPGDPYVHTDAIARPVTGDDPAKRDNSDFDRFREIECREPEAGDAP